METLFLSQKAIIVFPGIERVINILFLFVNKYTGSWTPPFPNSLVRSKIIVPPPPPPPPHKARCIRILSACIHKIRNNTEKYCSEHETVAVAFVGRLLINNGRGYGAKGGKMFFRLLFSFFLFNNIDSELNTEYNLKNCQVLIRNYQFLLSKENYWI